MSMSRWFRWDLTGRRDAGVDTPCRAGFLPRNPPKSETAMIENRYQPGEVESRIYAAWEQAGAFRAGRPERAAAKPYCIVIPPPNVTGSLHMGHALNNTLQDILCRFERMRGRDVLWQPGTDHAGIATQAVVERQLMERQESSRAMGREAFIKRVWEWKAESGGTIVEQLKRLGASCDWSRERFTMGGEGRPDDQMVRAVLKAFVELYNTKNSDGGRLIYKDKRLVNWDPQLQTAISDLEVQEIETKGSLWYIRYPIAEKRFNPEDPSTFVVVATTRPETMLGDTAVAVHPKNERLKGLIGQTAFVPLVDRPIPIIGDEYADPEKGSGAVKITPAHDFNDFKVWERHRHGTMSRYPLINILSRDGKLLLEPNLDFKRGDPTPETFRTIERFNGLDRFVARKRIVERLEELGRIEKIAPHTYVVPHGDRSGAVIEPYLTDQWYVDAKTLAQRAIEAVRSGKMAFVPQQWESTFFNWMENIQPWCISRQIWWGHQIPCWYGFKEEGEGRFLLGHSDMLRPTLEEFVAPSMGDAILQAGRHYGTPKIVIVEDEAAAFRALERQVGQSDLQYPIWRDPDVLDTWFSSALWPFSTLGWPEETPELKRFYPTTTLVTGFDIIFFWVARMMMMGLHFMQKVPFHDVYIHALVRDASGAKMSKSKGNVIDPLALIDTYGADALRFTLAAMAAQGRDIKLSEQRVEGYRNFATKLWNAARFAEINGCAMVDDFDPRQARETLNRWIAHETARTAAEVTAAIEAYKFNDAAGAIYRFVWNIYCDWYVELAKPVLTGPDGDAKSETRAMVAWARDQILKLLHPFMPFVTEELWPVTTSSKRNVLLALSEWPSLEGIGDAKAEAEIGWVIELIAAIRSVRAEMNVNVPLPLVMVRVGDQVWQRAQRWSEFIMRMARISAVTRAPTYPQGAVQLVVRGEVAALPLAGIIDLAAERARLAKEMAKAEADIARVDAKLNNPNFVARAPEEVVEEEKEKREEAVARKAKIAEALERLKASD
jgi:valyl-tRNA synthetase